MQPIPPNFARMIIEVHKEQGAAWLKRLPGIIDDFATRWGIIVGPPFEPLSYNYVAPAVRSDGSDVVLKLGVPESTDNGELEALRLYDGRGIVRLLESDPEQSVMLLERLKPGTMLSSLSDDRQATSIARLRSFPNTWPDRP